MAKHNFSRNIGLTFCSLLAIFVLVLFLIPNLTSISQNVASSKKKSEHGTLILNILHHEKFIEGNKNQGLAEILTKKLEDSEEITGLNSFELLSKSLGPTKASNQNSITEKSNIGNKIITFNLKLNSFSKESTDLLD